MFPKVQFIVTTHAPLFLLGMQRLFGEDGFAIYRMPKGQRISAEEFSELGKRISPLRRQGNSRRTLGRRSKSLENRSCFVRVTEP